jgi:flagellar biosynthesis/type III secretory pathway protein FliH
MSSIIRGDFAKNMTTEVFGQQRAESFQRLALPRLNFNGQPVEDQSSKPTRGRQQHSQESEELSASVVPVTPEPQQSVMPPVVEIPDETLSIFYDRAFQKGLDEGRMQAYAEVEELKRRYSESLQSLINISKQLEDSNKLQLIQLACTIAEKIIRTQVVTHPETLLNMITKAFEEVSAQDEVTVVCNMDDYEYLIGHLDQLKSHPNHTFRINLMVDDMLERGDFRIQTPQGSTDWKTQPQLEAMRDVLTREG